MILKLKEKKGGTEILQLIIMFTVITFIVMFPLATFSINQKKNFMEDSKTLGLQMASRVGGVTPEVKNEIIKDMKTKGFDTSKVVIKTNADGTLGKPLIPINSNTDISLQIFAPASSDVALLQVLWGMVGLKPGNSGYAFGNSSSTYWYFTQGYILSEKP